MENDQGPQQPKPRANSQLTWILISAVLGVAILWGAVAYNRHRAETEGREETPAQPPMQAPAPAQPPAAAPAATESAPGEGPRAGYPYGLEAPPRDSAAAFVNYMRDKRGEDPKFLELRYQRFLALLNNKDLWREKEMKAFLLTPREKFCRPWNLPRAYDHAFLDIHYGVTISGPHLVSRMTSALDVQPGEKVLEIGTGSGYQSAYLAYLTDKVYTIEIIEPLEKETEVIYRDLAAKGYPEFANVTAKADDGYYGWAEHAPFDKIIVTCGIDHIPPELLKQLTVGGTMVIPVGPPGAQVVLKVTKKLDDTGNVTIVREDIYGGKRKVPFVPFTKKGGGTWNR